MDFQPGQTVGIDLGTTFSTLAVLDEEGNPIAIPNDEDQVITPSLVLVLGKNHVEIGPNRMRAAMEDPEKIVERIKREMGSADFKRNFDGQEVNPEFISSLILKKLKQDAEARIGPIGNAVITVPYYFNDARRKATQDAGKMAGLNVVDIINEPTAATLTYAWLRNELGATGAAFDKPRMAMVYDLGGGTFDVTLVRYTPTHFQVLATDGDVHLGGVDWSDRLAEYVAGEFQSRHGLDPRTSPQAMQILRNDCDLAKIALSDQKQFNLSFRHEGKSITVPITREHFEDLTADLVQRTIDTMEVVLEQAGVKIGDIEAVVLVGGSTRMPRIIQAVEQFTGKPTFRQLSPDTAVAQGAAIHAAILDARIRGSASPVAEKVRRHLGDVQQDDVNSHGLGVAAKNPRSGKLLNHVMIPRNSKLPIEVKQTFVTNHDGQQRVNIQVMEGDAPDPAACTLIGNCRITGLPEGLPKGSPIQVTYAFDRSGRVRVSARDVTGGREAKIEIERRGGLDEQEVDAYARLASEYKVE